MNKVSRRQLAHWAAGQLVAGKSASSVAKHLAAVLKDTKTTNQIGFLIDDIAWELEQQKELAVGKVTSASPLSASIEQALKAQIKRATQAKAVVLEKNVDKSVIGGVRVETSSRVWDSTVARELAELKEVF